MDPRTPPPGRPAPPDPPRFPDAPFPAPGRPPAAWLAAALDGVADGFFALDRLWRFAYLNRPAERLVRRRRADLLGRTVWDEFPAAVGLAFERESRRAVADRRPVEFEAYYPPHDAWYSVRAVPAEPGLAVYFRSVTGRGAWGRPGGLPRGSGTVLLAEGDEGVRAVAGQTLTVCGYTVLAAADGEEAVRVGRGYPGRIDLVVADVGLPGMGGPAAVARVRAAHPGAGVVYLSGYGGGPAGRGEWFLPKPFTPSGLAAKVGQVLAAGRAVGGDLTPPPR